VAHRFFAGAVRPLHRGFIGRHLGLPEPADFLMFPHLVRLRRFMRHAAVVLPKCVMLAALTAATAQATEPGKKPFQLPDGDAMITLKQFVEQSGAQVFYFVGKVQGVTTHAVQGEMSARTALELMLQNTPLRAVQDDRTGAFRWSSGKSASPFPRRPPRPAAIPAPMKSSGCRSSAFPAPKPILTARRRRLRLHASAGFSSTRRSRSTC